jgi:hypothetical protein
MTFFRASFGIISRSSGGSALRRSAYQRCTDEGEFEFSDKAHELVTSEVMLPENAPTDFKDPVTLWTAAEAAEKRIDSQLARTFELAIPHEVPEHLRNDFARDMLSWLTTEHGFAVEWSRHKADHVFGKNDTQNDHVHAVVSLRSLGPEGFNAKKDREFNSLMRANDGRQVRKLFADRMNAFFERHSIAASVTHEPLKIDAFRIDTAPKKLIQEIKRNKDNAANLSPTARDFIRARHAKKRAVADFQNAAQELKSARKSAEARNTNGRNDRSGNSERSPKTGLPDQRAPGRTDRGSDRKSGTGLGGNPAASGHKSGSPGTSAAKGRGTIGTALRSLGQRLRSRNQQRACAGVSSIMPHASAASCSSPLVIDPETVDTGTLLRMINEANAQNAGHKV